MAVNLPLPSPPDLIPCAGIELGHAEAGVRKANRKDVLVISSAPGATVAGVFTTNRFCAAPVQVCQSHLAAAAGHPRAVVNTGNANAGTGETGLANADGPARRWRACSAAMPQQILPFSTGVILEPLPVERIVAGLPQALANAARDNWYDAARNHHDHRHPAEGGIAQVQIGGKTVTLTGISKGAGMITPNMATMLGLLATDAKVAQPVLRRTGEARGRPSRSTASRSTATPRPTTRSC